MSVCWPLAALSQPVVSVVTPMPSSPVLPGQTVTMGVATSGLSDSYQWKLNGATIPGATGSSFTLVAAGAADRGAYEVIVTGAGGATAIAMGTMSVASSDAHLINLSGRAMVGPGSDVMIAGFVSRGDASSTNKNVLVRGMGPALSGMGGMQPGGVLSNPVLTVFDGQAKAMASNMGWMNAPSVAAGSGVSQVPATMRSASMAMMNAVGAFAPAAGSTDSAIMMNAPYGAYTAVMAPVGNASGVALFECYDADDAVGDGTNTTRFANISIRANVGTGTSSVIVGFVISPGPSQAPGTVLLRAMGPALAGMGLSNALAKPTMTLFDANMKPIATSAGWENAPIMATGTGASSLRAGIVPASLAMMGRMGAFPPAAGSADSALIATLPPGAYTVVVSGLPDIGGRPMTGIVLCEIYDVQ